MFLLDTNVISELRRPERANRNLAAWAGSIPFASFFLSAISILEIEIARARETEPHVVPAACRSAAKGRLLWRLNQFNFLQIKFS
jgi:predicted nucleic acid-binding protein